MEYPVFCGVGSNVGDRRAHLRRGEELIGRHPAVRVVRKSQIYHTKPVGGPAQPMYLNAVWQLATSLSPVELLDLFHRVEECLGRVREEETRWGPRTLDLDILFYDDRVIETKTLTVPHPRAHERLFVLEPLSELAPNYTHPLLNATVWSLLSRISAPAFVS